MTAGLPSPGDAADLQTADAALQAASAALTAAEEAYQRAGRADLAGQLRPAVEAIREVELGRLNGAGDGSMRSPTDWFQE